MAEKKNPATRRSGAKEADLGNASGVDVTRSAPSAPVHSVLDQRLSAEHLAELQASAVSDDVIEASGVYTAWTTEDLPEPLQWVGNRDGALPALVFPLAEAGGGETWQVKPQPGSISLADGRSPKYIGPSKDSGYPTPALIERRAVNDTTRRVLFVEGTKQDLAVLSATDEDTAVYGLTGITSWMGGDDGPRACLINAVTKR
jgi:DNA polymerase-1